MGNRRVEFKFDERSMVDPDDLTDEQLDDFLRQFGYDPEQVKLRGKAFVEVALANMRLRADLAAARERIRQLEEAAAHPWNPDWSKAPDDANWWAMDLDGWCYWYTKEPEIKPYTHSWSEGSGIGKLAGRWIPMQWRDSKCRRPQPQDGQNPTE